MSAACAGGTSLSALRCRVRIILSPFCVLRVPHERRAASIVIIIKRQLFIKIESAWGKAKKGRARSTSKLWKYFIAPGAEEFLRLVCARASLFYSV